MCDPDRAMCCSIVVVPSADGSAASRIGGRGLCLARVVLCTSLTARSVCRYVCVRRRVCYDATYVETHHERLRVADSALPSPLAANTRRRVNCCRLVCSGLRAHVPHDPRRTPLRRGFSTSRPIFLEPIVHLKTTRRVDDSTSIR